MQSNTVKCTILQYSRVEFGRVHLVSVEYMLFEYSEVVKLFCRHQRRDAGNLEDGGWEGKRREGRGEGTEGRGEGFRGEFNIISSQTYLN